MSLGILGGEAEYGLSPLAAPGRSMHAVRPPRSFSGHAPHPGKMGSFVAAEAFFLKFFLHRRAPRWFVFLMGLEGASTPFPGGGAGAGVLPGLPAAVLDPRGE